jgi:PAS domain-containing protein
MATPSFIRPNPDNDQALRHETARRNWAEAALAVSEEHFRMLVTGVKDYAIFMLDPNGVVSTWNAGAERIKGYRAEEIIGKHFSRFYTPEDLAVGRTDSSDDRDVERCYRAGANSYIKKPVDLDGFLQAIRRLTQFWLEVVILPTPDGCGS